MRLRLKKDQLEALREAQALVDDPGRAAAHLEKSKDKAIRDYGRRLLKMSADEIIRRMKSHLDRVIGSIAIHNGMSPTKPLQLDLDAGTLEQADEHRAGVRPVREVLGVPAEDPHPPGEPLEIDFFAAMAERLKRDA